MAAIVIGAFMSAPAHADPDIYYTMYTDDGDPGGKVRFYPDGDVTYLCDIESDGAHVEIAIWNVTKDPNVYEYGFVDQYNDGECSYRDAWGGQPWNMAEGHCFSFRIRLVKDGNVVSGSTDWARWRNYNNVLSECPGVD